MWSERVEFHMQYNIAVYWTWSWTAYMSWNTESGAKQTLAPPYLALLWHSVHLVLLQQNLCHLHVSSHRDTVSTSSCSNRTSVTSMSPLTVTPCPLRPAPTEPLSPPCLLSPWHRVHFVLLQQNLCHLHVSSHRHTVSTSSCSNRTPVTSMSPLTVTPCPLRPASFEF